MSTPTDEEINAALGARLRYLRLRQGWTQVQLADAIGRSNAAVSHMEKGFTGISVVHIYRIAMLWGLHPATFFRIDLPGCEVPLQLMTLGRDLQNT